MTRRLRRRSTTVTTAALLGLAGFLWGTPPERRADDETRHVIVQAANLDGATAAVRAVGGEVTHQLGIINAVGAHLTLDEVRRVEAVDATVRVHADRQTTVAGKKKNRTASTSTTSTTSKTAGNVFSVPPTYIGQVIDASTLHEQGLRGAGSGHARTRSYRGGEHVLWLLVKGLWLLAKGRCFTPSWTAADAAWTTA